MWSLFPLMSVVVVRSINLRNIAGAGDSLSSELHRRGEERQAYTTGWGRCSSTCSRQARFAMAAFPSYEIL